MKHMIKRIGILLAIFLSALIIYLWWAGTLREQADTVYVAMEQAALPVIYPEMFGRNMNEMHGYFQDMGQKAARESLTVLPDDRRLQLHIQNGNTGILGIRFEIRTLDLERLLERTQVENWSDEGENQTVILPIQNLLSKGTEYLLKIELDTENHGTVYYYTRILWTDETIPRSMVDLAADFSAKTFNYEEARQSLTTYLEVSDTEDNSSFGKVTIRSNFTQLTWGQLKMQPVGDVRITLKETSGVMGTVALKYLAERMTSEGSRELYEVEENFTMKWNEIRTYLMDYERETNQVFAGERSSYSGKRIMLGITNDGNIHAKTAAGGQLIAFVSNRDLWSYDQADKRAFRIFSFRDSDIYDVKSNYDQHDIRILSVADSGDVTFMVYGYMNRGANEGNVGIAVYQYDESQNALREMFFIPVAMPFEQLQTDIEQLAYLTGGNMLYILVNQTIHGIDLNSNEYMVVADGLTEGSYAIASDKSQVAWQSGSDLYHGDSIHWMNLDTGAKNDIQSEDGQSLRTLGFVEHDLVYGVAVRGEEWIFNGRVRDLPMSVIEILNEDLAVESRYEKAGYYLTEVEVTDSRIHLVRVQKTSANQYVFSERDTVVCNESAGFDPLAGIGWYASEEKGKLYFVQIENEIRSNTSVKMTTPRKITYDRSEQLQLSFRPASQEIRFYAYGGGHFLGSFADFTDAMNVAYGKMGIVVDQNHRMIWSRVNRSNLRTIKEPVQAAALLLRQLPEFEMSRQYDDGILIIDASGATLNQILYFVDQGCPVVAYDRSGSYVLINGYDQYNITITDPVTGSTSKMGLNDGAEHFSINGNDFICALLPE